MKDQSYDVVIIGAGVIGSAVARELSRYRLRIAVLEKELDVACGNSSRNTGVLHGGFTYRPGSLKAECTVEGNREFDQAAKELDVPFKRSGKVVVGFNDEDMRNILKFKQIGETNGVRGLEIIDKDRLYRIDASAGGEFAMYSPDSGILNPMQYTIALAENAYANGADFFFASEVTAIDNSAGRYRISAGDKCFSSRWVINCAGMNCVAISEMLGISGHQVKGFKGEYFVLDKKAGQYLNIPVYPAPNAKGGFSTHATPTIDGNVLIGPDSYLTDDPDDFVATREHMQGLIEDGAKMFKHIKRDFFIRNFAGTRWKRVDPATGEILDFLIETRTDKPGIVNLIGIESPGLTCALPIARRVAGKIRDREQLDPKPSFNPVRRGITPFAGQPRERQQALISADPNYGEIVCRCETITKAEILRAINNPLGVVTVTGIKNRTRATMGRCQGGYCETRIAALIQKTLGSKETEIRYQHAGSYLFTGKVREDDHAA